MDVVDSRFSFIALTTISSGLLIGYVLRAVCRKIGEFRNRSCERIEVQCNTICRMTAIAANMAECKDLSAGDMGDSIDVTTERTSELATPVYLSDRPSIADSFIARLERNVYARDEIFSAQRKLALAEVCREVENLLFLFIGITLIFHLFGEPEKPAEISKWDSYTAYLKYYWYKFITCWKSFMGEIGSTAAANQF